MTNSSKIGESEVQMDRRFKERREEASNVQPAAAEEAPRRKKQRRRQIDPTTCERDYNGEEIVFMQALDAYKRSSGRMFPTCSEILEVIRALGYVKLSQDEITFLDTMERPELETAPVDEFDPELADCT
jgi:hypothetical protein